jgi:hypothetical protein
MLAALILHASDATSPARAARPSAEQAFQALASGGTGGLTADDLQAAIISISAEGARRAAAAGKGAQKLLARLDSDGDGQLSQQEFLAGVPKGLLRAKRADAPEPPPDAPPATEAVRAYTSVEQLGRDVAAA